MFFSGKWIRANGRNIFTPFYENQIDCNAYTMTVGSEVYTSPEGSSPSEAKISQLYSGEPFSIRPGQFAFLITREYVNIPIQSMGFINLKNGLKVQGLINVSGFHVDPGYDGKLIFAVFNAGPKNIILREGDDAFLIWLARIEEPSSEYSKSDVGFRSITSKLAANIPRESTSLVSLSARVEKLERYMWIAIAAAPVIVSIVLSIVIPVIMIAARQK